MRERFSCRKCDGAGCTYCYDYNKMKLAELEHHKKKIKKVIRDNAQSLWEKKAKQTPCQRCGYQLMVHVCHIKAVSTFPLDSTPEQINDRANICFLCPNCHYELDHGYLEIVENGDNPSFKVVHIDKPKPTYSSRNFLPLR